MSVQQTLLSAISSVSRDLPLVCSYHCNPGGATMKLCWTTLVICWFAMLAGVNNEMFTAVVDMKRMFNAEHEVAKLLKSYVKQQQARLTALSRSVALL